MSGTLTDAEVPAGTGTGVSVNTAETQLKSIIENAIFKNDELQNTTQSGDSEDENPETALEPKILLKVIAQMAENVENSAAITESLENYIKKIVYRVLVETKLASTASADVAPD